MNKDTDDFGKDDNKWVDNVVNRALASTFGSENQVSESADSDALSESITANTELEPSSYERYPYPDEDAHNMEKSAASEVNESDNRARKALEWLAVIVGALLVAFLIKTFLMQAYYIPSSSMTPALQVGDRVLVNKLSYQFGEISRGDLIVFKRTDNGTGIETDLIKRVIATEGEILRISEGNVYITENEGSAEKLLVEPYLAEGVVTTGFAIENLCPQSESNTCLIPENQVFVMGDNRSGSRDSRYFGPVDERDVVGRAFIRIWPLGSLKLL